MQIEMYLNQAFTHEEYLNDHQLSPKNRNHEISDYFRSDEFSKFHYFQEDLKFVTISPFIQGNKLLYQFHDAKLNDYDYMSQIQGRINAEHQYAIQDPVQNIIMTPFNEQQTKDEQTFSEADQNQSNNNQESQDSKEASLDEDEEGITNLQEQKKQRSNRKRVEADLENVDVASLNVIIICKYFNRLTQLLVKGKKIKPQISLQNCDRTDVLLKTIIREIRKVYLQQFQKETRYLRVQRYRHQKYYIVAIKSFIEQKLDINKVSLEGESYNNQDFREELIFFLGSMFYPKKMLALFEDHRTKKIIDMINSSLYQFTLTRFNFLNNWAAFRFLTNHFIVNHSLKSLQRNKAMVLQIEDFKKGLEYLQKVQGGF
ncbi:UNKNOWN [Stylonychia lemnae]|uniref:Uncharacterized protein n=1 Tax=Stylonychia lemnae TaxID=5949 RepID=A0A078AEC0_STYLE|nr:UNKNOWN [Stylonychia lemnae]|eukprot:CDW80604.1 UNKNOWN [Stylonychia lemnae]